MTYVDGVVAPVPTANREAFLAHAEASAALFREFSALKVVECWGDDVPDGKLTSLPRAVKLQPGETVIFSWILWPSKAARDEGWKRIMAGDRMRGRPMPFDGKRMIFGGFEMILEA